MILGCIWFEVSQSVYQFIGGENDSREVFKRSASVDIIWVTRRDRDSGEQTTWSKQSLPQKYVRVGCQLNSDQALRLHCLKGHVKARDSTLWQYRWQKVSQSSCTKKPLLEGVEQPKISPENPGNTFSDALRMSRFQNFAADDAKKNWFQSINEFELIRPKILKSCFLHCTCSVCVCVRINTPTTQLSFILSRTSPTPATSALCSA